MGIILNRDELATSALRGQVLDIIEAGIRAVLPRNLLNCVVRYDPRRNVLTVCAHRYELGTGRMFVVGGGKASAAMAEAFEEAVGPQHIAAGIVTCSSGESKTRRVEVVEAGIPLPDRRGLEGVKRMLAMKDGYGIGENDVVVCLLSGGGSALMPCPVEGLGLEDKQAATELLLSCGAEIGEINAVRKHLSRTKGGRLGRFFSPARVVSLMLSDVVGNHLDVIASGPTVPDPSTFSDALNVLRKYGLLCKVPKSVIKVLERGADGQLEETPVFLQNCHNHIIGDNRMALEAMADAARGLGLQPCVVTAEQTGDTTVVARMRAREIIEGRYDGCDVVLIGGETTPTLPEAHGRGGRNQHYAAVSMTALREYAGEWAMASVGTDGSDYVLETAGAIVDHDSLEAARVRGLDVESYLERYDSNGLLSALGNCLIETGNTGTNVCDVIVYVLGGRRHTANEQKKEEESR